MFQEFPYTNFHQLNLDWIVKIAKDFLDQYTHIQEVIQTGLDDLAESRETGLDDLAASRAAGLEELNQKTLDGLADLQTKYDTLEGLLQAWYDTHSADIAGQLADAIIDFNTAAEAKSQALLDSWPADYSELVTEYNALKNAFSYVTVPISWDADGTDKYIDANGVIGTTEGFHYSDLLLACEGDAILSFDYSGAQAGFRIHGYDKNGNWIRQVGYELGVTTSGTIEFTIDSDVRYIRISAPSIATNMVFVETLANRINNNTDRTERIDNHTVEWDVNDAYINASGNVGSDSNMHYSKEMRVSPGTAEFAYTYSGTQAGSRVHGYDINHNWVEQVTYRTASTGSVIAFTIPNGISFVRISMPKAATNVTFKNVVTIKEDIKNLQLDVKETDINVTGIKKRLGRVNLFNKDDEDIEEGKFISGISSGEVVWTNNAAFGESGYITVEAGQNITFLHHDPLEVANLSHIFFDKNKNPLVYHGGMPSTNYRRVPLNAKYVRVAFALANINTFMAITLYDDEVPYTTASSEVYAPYQGLTLPYIIKRTDEEINTFFGKQWNGKTWYAYGTSITENNGASGRLTYVYYLAEMSGMTAVNKGLGGKGIGTWGWEGNHGEVYDAICNITDGKLDADLITLETGANDVNAETPLGTVYDTGRTTLAGCLNDCLRYLQANTDAQIAVINSPASTNIPSATSKYYEWAKMVEEICNINRVHFINNNNNMGYAKISDATKGSLYVRDSIHETDLGSYIMAENMWYQLRNIPLFYTVIPS